MVTPSVARLMATCASMTNVVIPGPSHGPPTYCRPTCSRTRTSSPSSIPSERRSATFSGITYTPSFGISDVVTSVSPMRACAGTPPPAVGQLAEVSMKEVIDMRGRGDEEIRCRATPLEHLGLKLPVHGSTLILDPLTNMLFVGVSGCGKCPLS